MYINLGTLRLQYTETTNDWIILGEIVDSEMSYEKPVLVRSVDELDIWFGRDFSDYNYLVELIKSGVVLYLYKPVSPEKLKTENYINLGEYQSIGSPENLEESLLDTDIEAIEEVRYSPEVYYFIRDGRTYGYLPESHELSEVSRVGRKEISLRESLGLVYFNTLIWGEGIIFYMVGNSNDPLIWFEDKITYVSELQQNLYVTTESYNNRDTLAITQDLEVPYVYPRFNVDGLDYSCKFEDTFEEREIDIRDFSVESINMNDIDLGYQTYVFEFQDTNVFGNQDYMVSIKPETGNSYLLSSTSDTHDIPSEYYYKTISGVTHFSEILETNLEYIRINNCLISKTPIPVTYFQKLPEENSFTPSIPLTYELLSSKFKDKVSIEFWGKTIGKSAPISIIIEKSDEHDNWMITISRYTYSEIFEGPLVGSERLDYRISKESRLVYCNIKNSSEGIQEGEYKLWGATQENNTRDKYLHSLSQVFEVTGEPIYPDYFLIPSKYNYISKSVSQDLDYYPEYEIFLKYSKLSGCQFLIENDDPQVILGEDGIYYDTEGHQVEPTQEDLEILEAGGDYKYNYLGDKENRLLYFFRPISVLGNLRPAYYVYLKGLLSNDYQVSTKDILYSEPTPDPYSNFDIEGELETYKSNYLVCNNLIYYYKKYMDGKDYTTTGWMRFVVSKIYREFEKNRWNYLGEKSIKIIEDGIRRILDKISKNFKIIGGINLASFTPELQKNQVTLEIDVYVNDLLKNNLKLNITLNYNKED